VVGGLCKNSHLPMIVISVAKSRRNACISMSRHPCRIRSCVHYAKRRINQASKQMRCIFH